MLTQMFDLARHMRHHNSAQRDIDEIPHPSRLAVVKRSNGIGHFGKLRVHTASMFVLLEPLSRIVNYHVMPYSSSFALSSDSRRSTSPFAASSLPKEAMKLDITHEGQSILPGYLSGT